MESNDIVVLDIERIRVIVVHIRNSIIVCNKNKGLLVLYVIIGDILASK